MKEKKNKQLTPMQKRFIHEYQIDMNATQAAIRAGYSEKTAYSQGQRLLKHVEVFTRIQQTRQEVIQRLQQDNDDALLKAVDVERRLDQLINFNLKDFVDDNGNPKAIHELTDEQAVCVRELEVLETQIGAHRSFKFYDKIQAIKLKMQRLGMLKEKVETRKIVETYEERRIRQGFDKR